MPRRDVLGVSSMSGADRNGTAAWLRRYNGDGPGAVRLVFFPHAGGSASYFFPLSRHLPADVETFAVQYPGRQDRRAEPPADTVAELAAGVVAALDTLEGPDVPTVLFGHSLGAVVAFEAAKRLESRLYDGLTAGPHAETEGAGPAGPAGPAAHAAPVALVVSGRRAPSRQTPENLHLRDDAGVLAELTLLGGTEEKLLDDEDLVKMILPAVRADYRALSAYVQSWSESSWQPLTCPLVVMVGDSDPVAPVADALAWEEFTTGDFQSEIFPGGHFYLSGHQERVADSIRRVLKTYA
ncbi:pyochelin biosynthetic protein PchC [Catenulispora sp. MAP5-51]